MTKRSEAFELFDQGKGIDDPDVLALGLKKKTLQNNYRAWKKLQVQPEEAPPEPSAVEPLKVEPSEVRLDSLKVTERFLLKGETYQVGDKDPFSIVCNRIQKRTVGSLPEDTFWHVVQTVSLAIFTMVKPTK